MSEEVNYLQWYNKLRNHDWFYAYSDDHRVWQEGCKASKELEAQSKVDEKTEFMYNQFVDYINGERELPKLEEFVDEQSY